MSLHSELLKQAYFLARKEPKKPIQASLRRSVSAAYYAVFHLLVDAATRLMLAGSVRSSLRDSLARAFSHSAMKQTAVAFAGKSMPSRIANAMERTQVQPPLIDFAAAFVQIQEARHDADCNRSIRFTRREALDIADLADQAFRDWHQARGSLPADVFLTGLLVYRQMQG